MRILAFRLPHRGIRSATPTTFDFGAIFPFTFVSAYHLPVYASQWPLPDTTQDSVPGCWLGFTRAAISGCCIPCACKAQFSSNRTCRFTASGSRTRQHAFAHEKSYAVPCVDTAHPAVSKPYYGHYRVNHLNSDFMRSRARIVVYENPLVPLGFKRRSLNGHPEFLSSCHACTEV
jgi:hypothetical protein